MKKADLMIGDWVIRKRDKHPMTVVELRYAETIAAITPDDVYYGDMQDYHESEVEPISLTPEILEKNGFELSYSQNPRSKYWKIVLGDKYLQIFKSTTRYDMYGYEEEKEFQPSGQFEVQFFNYKFYTNRSKTMHFATFYFDYVHQLQHALHLCGINKEIQI